MAVVDMASGKHGSETFQEKWYQINNTSSFSDIIPLS